MAEIDYSSIDVPKEGINQIFATQSVFCRQSNTRTRSPTTGENSLFGPL